MIFMVAYKTKYYIKIKIKLYQAIYIVDAKNKN